MKKKVSFKYSEESSEMEPIILSVNEIDKKYIFDNNSEIIVKNIIEKILINVFTKIKIKNLDELIGVSCSNFILQEINSLLSCFYPAYENENYFLTDELFINNYIREETSWDECNLSQPTPGKIERWKIHRTFISVIVLTYTGI